jgi:hypothetical protein
MVIFRALYFLNFFGKKKQKIHIIWVRLYSKTHNIVQYRWSLTNLLKILAKTLTTLAVFCSFEVVDHNVSWSLEQKPNKEKYLKNNFCLDFLQ